MTTPGLEIVGVAIRVRGLVQGVGFRPTVWRLARDLGLRGAVLNDAEGVLVRAWAPRAALDAFRARLTADPPPLARIDAIEETPLEPSQPPAGFEIAESADGPALTGVTPDAATCPACLAEILDEADRRAAYPFANCTHCGPRLSIVRAVPYDRARTSMADFPMCPDCRREYADPADRRFHAQPNACPACGPRIWLENRAGETIEATDPIGAAAAMLRAGRILAVKGIGGFHLACDAADEAVVAELRRRKRRDDKPFALMAPDPATIERFAAVSRAEAELLRSAAAPIVVLDRRGAALAPSVAPGQASLGFMLPYAPLHHLLTRAVGRVLVLTSGNRSDEPQCVANEEARTRLAGVADAWLTHDREIVNRLDDSVMRFAAGAPRTLRRARGFAPAPLPLPKGFENPPRVLAMGGALKATFCLLGASGAVLSQHIGDLESAAANADYRRNLALYRRLFAFDPEIVAVDLHPDYLSTRAGAALAEREGLRLEPVQHHHAHVAACMAEHLLPRDHDPALGVALDGLGLGADGALWGGEFLLADYVRCERLAHFQPAPLLGGAQAMREPWRNAYAFLSACLGWSAAAARYADTEIVKRLREKPLATLDRMAARGVNAPMATSAGRLFDAAAAAIGVRPERIGYEGQAAIELEALAARAPDADGAYGFDLAEDGRVVDWTPLWRGLMEDLLARVAPAVVARRFHETVAEATATTAARLARDRGVSTVCLTGGVFQNRLLLDGVTRRLAAGELRVLSPSATPANDGGLALGQAMIAAARARLRPPSRRARQAAGD